MSTPARSPSATATPIAPTADLAETGLPSPEPLFRLVLPRDKQRRLAQRVRLLPRRQPCPRAGCPRLGLGVVLVETEQEALLCPRHELLYADGAPVAGQPMFVTAAW